MANVGNIYNTIQYNLRFLRIWILQDHVTACVQFSMIFFFSVLCISLFVIVFVWQGTHYWWWLSPLSRLVLRVETLVVFIRMFVFVFVDLFVFVAWDGFRPTVVDTYTYMLDPSTQPHTWYNFIVSTKKNLTACMFFEFY